MADKYRFENGDWVQGRFREGELIHGYVETVDSNQGIVKVHVVESDNEKVSGKSIWILNKWIEKLPDITISNESQLLELIDLALLSKDEQWFKELSSKLAFTTKVPEVPTEKSQFPISRNGIRNFDIKR
jgi:uncharacterized protein YpiB (UPF0302 family)